MTLVLDTSVLIDIETKDKGTMEKIEELRKVHYTPAAITFVNYFEFYFGAISKNIKSKQLMLEFINKFNCLKASAKTGEILAELKFKYDDKGLALPLADLIIASQVIENNMVLLTKDKDFEKISEVRKIVL
ncbi:type II toxin-antitoxin system VapC family toxin [Candidatus Woesearchaeota archaeon]|nr:type II toxin-antitoxin system VapC family toxin [Candidatus Woesearchaeota archaeon]